MSIESCPDSTVDRSPGLRAIVNGRLVVDGRIAVGQALVFHRKVVGIMPERDLAELPVDQVLDAQGLLVSPGLIDTHLHGIAGADAMDGTVTALGTMSLALARHGITAWLPTTMTADWAEIGRALQAIRQAMAEDAWLGARVLGAHLEGPYLSREFAGAQATTYLLPPNAEQVLEYRDVIRLVTYAPELDQAGAFAGQMLQAGIVPSIGHTGADFETVRQSIAMGVRHATHLFNAMPPLHHRQPGPVGACLTGGVSCELIADDLHVHPSIYRWLLQAIGLRQIILVSDSMRATDLGDGVYDLGGQAVQVEQSAARLENGRLAGSVLTLNRAVLHFQRATELPWPLALQAATGNPAEMFNLSGQVGSLQPGSAADIVLFDQEMNACLTIVQGNIVYSRE